MSARTAVSITLVVAVLIAVLVACGVATGLVSCGARQVTDFVGEQQPGAESAGELIGMQYSQLRELSAALDNIACKLEINEQAALDLKDIYSGEEASWPKDAREEARNLRWEHTALLQRYSDVAADYNVLRTDIRTLADDLGLEVDFVEAPESYSPEAGLCGNFTLPEEMAK